MYVSVAEGKQARTFADSSLTAASIGVEGEREPVEEQVEEQAQEQAQEQEPERAMAVDMMARRTEHGARCKRSLGLSLELVFKYKFLAIFGWA